ncbi:Alpha-1 3-glucosyltransferase [Fasciola gigantica]|uniref:Alpha-1,3-glucosyltransferase n=1 Tax=Fasciola gigantica TaxID=46835 RepID=A0A504YJA2_FASGI|nr:Alpha-1 3-glucosyltransferase [Fasciola gigantica]
MNTHTGPFHLLYNYLLVIVSAISFKLLFLFGYRSTDFEVHRNWKALTYSLPISQWYFESTSEWTLDYPPLFAWFERALAQIGSCIDPKLCVISKEPYASPQTVVYLRSTVILSETLLFFALWRLCKALSNSSSFTMKRKFISMAILLAFNYGLIIVDHIHFQYNGFLFGIFLLSVSFMIEKRFIAASVTFSVLFNMKHLFIYMAPVYFIHILAVYCLEKPTLHKFLSRFLKCALAVLGVTFLSIGPFIYMGQLHQLWSRLFPFGRGLCHAYWAPNAWALYNTVDKFLATLNSYYQFAPTVPSKQASMTGGLVGEIQHSILPSVRPLHTAMLTFIGMCPTLIQCARARNGSEKEIVSSNYVQFLTGLTGAAWSSFLFGWHVHEKAVLMILLPLNLLATVALKYRFIAFYVTTLGHYSLIPLIHTAAGKSNCRLHCFF